MRLVAAVLMMACLARAQEFDLVIANGRVMDPATGLDAVRQVGIRGGKIAAVSPEALHGRTVLDAKGLVVAPGFIDLHSHGQTPENYRFKAMDGVTTALEMEVGVSPVSQWYAAREGKALINFGASSGHLPARMAVMHDSGGLLPRDKAVERAATPEEQRRNRGIGSPRIGRGRARSRPGNRLRPIGVARRDSRALPPGGGERRPLSMSTCGMAVPWSPA